MRIRLMFAAVLVGCPLIVAAQRAPADPLPDRTPREFVEFRGTWLLDEPAGAGRIAGLPIARTLVIATTPAQISLVKDAADPEVYLFDGTESPVKDPRTGAVLDRRYSFALVAGMLALTSKRTRGQFTNIITDAYAVAGDTLTVERQLSVLAEPSGSLVTLSQESNSRQTLIYHRRN